MHIRIRILERKVILSDYADFCLSNGIPESQVESHVKIFDSYRRSKNFNGSIYSHEFSKNDYTIDNDDLLDLPTDYRTEDAMSTFSDSWEVKCAKFKEQNNIPKNHIVMPKKSNDISSAPIIKHFEAKQVVTEPTRLQQATSFVKKAAIAAPIAVATGYAVKKAYDNYNTSEAKTTDVVDWNSIFSTPVSSESVQQEIAKPATPLLSQPLKPLPALVDSSFKEKTFDNHDSAYESLKRYFESKGFNFNVSQVYDLINVDHCTGKAWVIPHKVSNEKSTYVDPSDNNEAIKSDISNTDDFHSVSDFPGSEVKKSDLSLLAPIVEEVKEKTDVANPAHLTDCTPDHPKIAKFMESLDKYGLARVYFKSKAAAEKGVRDVCNLDKFDFVPLHLIHAVESGPNSGRFIIEP